MASIAVLEEETARAYLRYRHERMLSRDLIPRIGRVLEEAGLAPCELQGVAVGLGPGSFTSLRIGVTAAKSLAWALGVPAAGAGALEAMIAGAPVGDGPILAAIDAAAGQAFAHCCDGGPEGAVLLPAGLYDYAEIRAFLARSGEVRVAADAVLAERLETEAVTHAEPDAVAVGRLALPALRAGGAPVHALVPRYLRRSVPEERLEGRAR